MYMGQSDVNGLYLSCIAIGIVSPLCPGFSIPSPRPRLKQNAQNKLPLLTDIAFHTKTNRTEYQNQNFRKKER
jgi:hypothetical protein